MAGVVTLFLELLGYLGALSAVAVPRSERDLRCASPHESGLGLLHGNRVCGSRHMMEVS